MTIVYRIHKDDEEVMENICALFCELSEYGKKWNKQIIETTGYNEWSLFRWNMHRTELAWCQINFNRHQEEFFHKRCKRIPCICTSFLSIDGFDF